MKTAIKALECSARNPRKTEIAVTIQFFNAFVAFKTLEF